MNKKYFKLYLNYAPVLDKLSDGDVGRLVKNILRMGRGEELEPMKDKTEVVFHLLAAELNRENY